MFIMFETFNDIMNDKLNTKHKNITNNFMFYNNYIIFGIYFGQTKRLVDSNGQVVVLRAIGCADLMGFCQVVSHITGASKVFITRSAVNCY